MTDSVPRLRVDARFSDVRLIRAGSQFAVYEAYDNTVDGVVALKVPDDKRPTWVHDMLHSQADLLRRVGSHPNIVTLHEMITLPDRRPALVLDRCVATLAETMADSMNPRMSLQRTLSVGIKLAGALETLHDAGALHCDVRPGSILVAHNGEPVLAALDEAVATAPGAPRFPQHAITAHTAPELLEGAAALPASDVYGLAATLYELAAGHAAFRQYAGESAATVIVRVLSGQVRPIVAPDVPLELSDLLTWAMSSDPARRPPTPAWFAEELGRLEARQGWPRTRMIVGT